MSRGGPGPLQTQEVTQSETRDRPSRPAPSNLGRRTQALGFSRKRPGHHLRSFRCHNRFRVDLWRGGDCLSWGAGHPLVLTGPPVPVAAPGTRRPCGPLTLRTTTLCVIIICRRPALRAPRPGDPSASPGTPQENHMTQPVTHESHPEGSILCAHSCRGAAGPSPQPRQGLSPPEVAAPPPPPWWLPALLSEA